MTKPAHTKELASALIVACGVFALSLLFFNTAQSTLLGLIALLVVLWTNEALPLAVVSLLPIVLFPAFGVLNTAATAHNYANPPVHEDVKKLREKIIGVSGESMVLELVKTRYKELH
ncbi:MAG: hypothetical protein AB7U24_02410 [Sulfurimonadaceae bacterium]